MCALWRPNPRLRAISKSTARTAVSWSTTHATRNLRPAPRPIIVASLAVEHLAQLGLGSVKNLLLCLRQVLAGTVAIKEQHRQS